MKFRCLLPFLPAGLVFVLSCQKGKHSPVNESSAFRPRYSLHEIVGKRPRPAVCRLTLWDVSFTLKACSCYAIRTIRDTVFIDTDVESGDLSHSLLSISYPRIEAEDTVFYQFQNRYYTFSMGPDLVYTDWKLYTSPRRILSPDSMNGNYRLPGITEEERKRFPGFTELEFYAAFREANYYDEAGTPYQHPSGTVLQQEYKRDRDMVKELLDQSGVEPHQVIITIKAPTYVKKVLVFRLGHMG